MSLTRKEFFRQGFLSLGKAALDIADTLKGGVTPAVVAESNGDAPPEPRPDMVATPFNDRCLARNCGCFACVERCEPQAIMVVPGEGIRIDLERCTGCGTCEYVCPVVPKAVALVPREKK
jgi:ferredoxin